MSFLLFLYGAALAQTRTITGRVTDSKTGEKMQGVSVTADNQKQGTVTAADGTYSITLNKESRVLNFSFVGYTAQSVPVKDKETIDLALDPFLQEFSVLAGLEDPKGLYAYCWCQQPKPLKGLLPR